MNIFSLFGNKTRVVVDGDHSTAHHYLGEARKLLHQLREQVGFQNLKIYQMQRKIGQAVISAMTVHGQEIVKIITPIGGLQVMERREEIILKDEKLYVCGSGKSQSDFSIVQRRNPDDGTVMWQNVFYPDASVVAMGIAANTERVFVLGYGFRSPYLPAQVSAFSYRGNLLWTKTFDGFVDSNYIACNEEYVALSLNTSGNQPNSSGFILVDKEGKIKWTYIIKSGQYQCTYPHGVAMDDNTVYANYGISYEEDTGNDDGKIYWTIVALDIKSGYEKWKVHVLHGGLFNYAFAISYDDGKIYIRGIVYQGDYHTALPYWRDECRDAQTGNLIWGYTYTEAYANYVGLPANSVYEKYYATATTGTLNLGGSQWRREPRIELFDTKHNGRLWYHITNGEAYGVAVGENKIYECGGYYNYPASSGGFVEALNIADGSIKWSHAGMSTGTETMNSICVSYSKKKIEGVIEQNTVS